MGNTFSKALGLRDGGSSTIDGGTTRLASDADHGQQTTTRRRKIEYDVKIVEKMIRNRRLAPFYDIIDNEDVQGNSFTQSAPERGRDLNSQASTEVKDSIESLATTMDSAILIDERSGTNNCGSPKAEKRRSNKRNARLEKATRMEALMREFTKDRCAECPICFLVSFRVQSFRLSF
jgi:hypothetical protein